MVEIDQESWFACAFLSSLQWMVDCSLVLRILGLQSMSESSRAFGVNASSSSSGGGGGGEAVAGTTGKNGGGGSVAFHRLFAFADGTDAALMLLGTLGAVANGAALPFMTVLFGGLIDAFGGAAGGDVVARVSEVSLQFIYLAVASAAASFIRKCAAPRHHLTRNLARSDKLTVIDRVLHQRWRAG